MYMYVTPHFKPTTGIHACMRAQYMRSNLIRSESHHDLYYDNTNQMKNPPWYPILLLVKVIMDVHAGPRIYRLVADNHARKCIVRRQPLHAVMRACMFEYTTLMWRVCQKSYTSSPHRARSVHDVSLYQPLRLDGRDSCVHMHVCVLKVYHACHPRAKIIIPS